MDEKKICPLRLIAMPAKLHGSCVCNGKECAWWVRKPLNGEGKCALVSVAEEIKSETTYY